MATEREKWKGLVKYFEDLWVKEYSLHYVGSSFEIFDIDHHSKDYFCLQIRPLIYKLLHVTLLILHQNISSMSGALI